MRVLVLEDDPDLLRSVVRFLRKAGYAVDEATDLADADMKLAVNDYDAAVFDRSVPDGDSVELVRKIRAEGMNVPVMFLTALDAVNRRVEGLVAGGDDYLIKPFAMDEMVARIHALTRRPRPAPDVSELRIGDLELHLGRFTVTRGGVSIELTAKEFTLLRYLVTHSGSVVTRSDLIEHCWDEHADPMSNVVDVRIASVRRKLGDPALIHTLRGTGYIFELRDP
jgi:DNA-binding response OmpR family regulator